MERVLKPELLDVLPPGNPAAARSRRDLRRLNHWMGNARHLARAIESLPFRPREILEMGAGDGTLMLEVARRLAARGGAPARLWLLDRQPVVEAAAIESFRAIGWSVTVIAEDVNAWLERPRPRRFDLAAANLFFHHFTDDQLRKLFRGIAGLCGAFVCAEPRRWFPAICATRFLWMLGCNGVTRHDAKISVRAGFRDRELSALWPDGGAFTAREYAAGVASQVFCAHRNPAAR